MTKDTSERLNRLKQLQIAPFVIRSVNKIYIIKSVGRFINSEGYNKGDENSIEIAE